MTNPEAKEKPAPVDSPVNDLLRRRWSPLSFSPQPVEPEKLRSLFEAARWSASSFGAQPWSFLVATNDNPAEFEKMLGCLVEQNAEWARNAAVLAISVAKLDFAQTGKPNRHAYYDVGHSVAYLSVEATALGLWVHQMAGFQSGKVREVYGVPEGYDPVSAIAIGYGAPTGELPEKLAQREKAPRTRMPASEFVFTGHWGRKAPQFP